MHRRSGFTLVEALACLTIAGMAASGLTLAISSHLSLAEHTLKQTIARGIVEQLADEVLTLPYVAPGGNPFARELGPSQYENAGAGRERFSEIGDYHLYAAQPPCDRWGEPLGEGDGDGGLRPAAQHTLWKFESWRETVEVYYVDDNNPARRLQSGQVSSTRVVFVRLYERMSDREPHLLAETKRLVSYVPD